MNWKEHTIDIHPRDPEYPYEWTEDDILIEDDFYEEDYDSLKDREEYWKEWNEE